MDDFRKEAILSVIDGVRRYHEDDLLQLNDYDSIREEIELYHSLVVNANARHNLIGKSTLDAFFNRHVIDSAQLLILLSKFLNDKSLRPYPVIRVADVGSGAGLPGMIFLIFVKNMQLHFVEKSPVKCKILQEFTEVMRFDERASVHEGRFEDLGGEMLGLDFIAARAFKSMEKMMSIMTDVGLKTPLLLLKGRGFFEEANRALCRFNFSMDYCGSMVVDDGFCVVASDVTRID